jgi:hypothetical protein
MSPAARSAAAARSPRTAPAGARCRVARCAACPARCKPTGCTRWRQPDENTSPYRHLLAGPGIHAARHVYTHVPADAIRVAALVEISAAAAALARTVVKLRRLDLDLIAPHVTDRTDLRAVLGRGQWLPTMTRHVPPPHQGRSASPNCSRRRAGGAVGTPPLGPPPGRRASRTVRRRDAGGCPDMALVNVIKGEQIPSAAFNVRTPIIRIPLWMVICWQTVKAFAWLVKSYLRFWYVTLPATFLTWLYLRYGWQGLAILFGSITGGAASWWFAHQSSCLRFGGYPLLARWRRFVCCRRSR